MTTPKGKRMMHRVLTTAIEFTYEWNKMMMECDKEMALAEDVDMGYRIPIWDDLTVQQKMDALEYVYKNEHDEDFGHSGCCKAIHQATAYYCVKFLKYIDEEDFFDDLDFMMWDSLNVRNGMEIKEMFGISEDF